MLAAQQLGRGTSQHITKKTGDAKLEFCDACIQVSVIMINELLNIIANEGKVQACGQFHK